MCCWLKLTRCNSQIQFIVYRPACNLIMTSVTNMLLTCLLLLFTQFGVGTTTGTQCPTNCSCTGDTSLVVDCRGLSDFDLKQLSDQLDSLLSSKVTYGRLTNLSIINSPLTHVPRSVCRLTTLTTLRLNYNRLARLPENCLTNLSSVKTDVTHGV